MPNPTALRPVRAAAVAAFAVAAVAALTAAAGPPAAAAEGPEGLAGQWIFVRNTASGGAAVATRPNSGHRFDARVESDAVVFAWGVGDQVRTYRYAADGAEETVTEGKSVSRHSGRWTDGAFRVTSRVEAPGRDGTVATTESQHTMRLSGDELTVEWKIVKPVEHTVTSLYRRAPAGAARPAAAGVSAVAWMAGAWTGTLGKASIEERWSPPAGGTLLATARTVADGRMVAFEYLRVVERDGGLVYVAQPQGGAATDFFLTTVSDGKAVFENPVHDFPQRITYTLGTGGALTAEIADLSGKRSQRFVFRKTDAE